jgi:hypothetical protein
MRTLIFGLFAAASLACHATVTISIDANLLKAANGTPMPTIGLVILVASTGDSTFTGPTASSFVSGDDIIVGKWDLSAFNTPGVLSDGIAGVPLANGWKEGNLLRLYWFPTLNINSTAPGANAPYGTYRDDVGIDGSFAWKTPQDGQYVSLKFVTSDANTDYDVTGSNPGSAGLASLTVGGGAGAPSLGIQLLGGGNVGLHLTGSPNGNYAVQYVNSLLNSGTPWQTLSSGTANSNGVIDFQDTPGTGPRFYRGQALP